MDEFHRMTAAKLWMTYESARLTMDGCRFEIERRALNIQDSSRRKAAWQAAKPASGKRRKKK